MNFRYCAHRVLPSSGGDAYTPSQMEAIIERHHLQADYPIAVWSAIRAYMTRYHHSYANASTEDLKAAGWRVRMVKVIDLDSDADLLAVSAEIDQMMKPRKPWPLRFLSSVFR